MYGFVKGWHHPKFACKLVLWVHIYGRERMKFSQRGVAFFMESSMKNVVLTLDGMIVMSNES